MTAPTITEEQQLDNLIRWRDELASGKWEKCTHKWGDFQGRRCALGVSRSMVWPMVADGSAFSQVVGLCEGQLVHVTCLSDDYPGDRFAAVIEYLNEHITRRKAALGVPVADLTELVAV